MKSVLISIQPKWCELIASGKKTVEVRKTRPKLETPFKCYIYCTKAEPLIFGDSNAFVTDKSRFTTKYRNAPCEAGLHKWNGKVIGEFVCNDIERVVPDYNPVYQEFYYGYVADLSEACLSEKELHKYAGIQTLYFWHISDLKIYDKPKELGEFRKTCKFKKSSFICPMLCPYYEYESPESANCLKPPLTRPPMSWCCVEGI